MIVSLRGTVLSIGLTSVVIETGGAGMGIQATPTTLSGLRIGEETLVYTEMVVCEDPLTLFSLTDTDERNSFRTLMSAKGAGAELALATLTVHIPNALRRAIASQDVVAPTRVPGLGPEGAQRVILNVTDKLGPVAGDDLGAAQTVVQSAQGVETMSGGGSEPHVDMVAALVQLSWNEASTQQTAFSMAAGAADGGQGPDTAVVLRASLRWLGGGHRG